MADDSIRVEVAYAKPEHQVIVAVDLPLDGTVEQAIQVSGILQQFPEIDLSQQKVGIFGQICKLNKPLTNRDRVEIYRALQQNPMDARRGRLQK